jgi:hypothetical protein
MLLTPGLLTCSTHTLARGVKTQRRKRQGNLWTTNDIEVSKSETPATSNQSLYDGFSAEIELVKVNHGYTGFTSMNECDHKEIHLQAFIWLTIPLI